MYPYLNDENNEREFDAIFDVTNKLLSKRKSIREKAAGDIVKNGKNAVRPLGYLLECCARSAMSDEELDALAEEVGNILVKTGTDALPDLKDFAENGDCNIYVNEVAQEIIFKIKGLDGKDKRNVCKHLVCMVVEKEKKKVLQCVICDAEFEYKNKKDKLKK